MHKRVKSSIDKTKCVLAGKCHHCKRIKERLNKKNAHLLSIIRTITDITATCYVQEATLPADAVMRIDTVLTQFWGTR